MSRNIIIGVVIAVVVVVGAVAYAVFRPPEEASAPIEAIPLDVEGTQTAEAGASAAMPPTAPTGAMTPTVAAPITPTVVAPSRVTPTVAVPATITPTVAAPAPTTPVTPTTAAAPTTPVTPTAPAGLTTFEIVQEESEARFLIDEVLRGSPVTVVGSTNQVAGQIAVNPADLSSTQIGVIQINARTLTTDNDFRNRAIKNAILMTNDYEYITFTPIDISGLPASGTVGETYNFQVVGDLNITDATRSVTFDVTVTPVSATRIEGTATTTVLYNDFGLLIPDAPPVDTVEDDVRLELSFVAEAV